MQYIKEQTSSDWICRKTVISNLKEKYLYQAAALVNVTNLLRTNKI